MTSTRAAAYLGGGALLVAYLAAANSAPLQEPRQPRDPVPRAERTPDALARDVENQAEILRARLNAAPAPDLRPRNPFSFAPAAAPRAVEPRLSRPADVAAVAAAPPLMPLSLMGIAEDTLASGPRRTAIIGGTGDALYFVSEGQTVADRYRVAKIGVDAVELTDLQTGGIRRLAMR